MFNTYFTDNELAELDSLQSEYIKRLNSVSREIKDLEKIFKEKHFRDECINFDGFNLIYTAGRIFYDQRPCEAKRLMECKKEIRLKVAPFLPTFAREMVKKYKERLKLEGY